MWCYVLLLLLCYSSPLIAEPLKVKVKSDGAILINASTGKILYEKESHRRFYPASVTKIASVLYVLKQKGDHLDEIATVSKEALAMMSDPEKKRLQYNVPAYWLVPDGTSMGLKLGERTTIRDLLFGMMTCSGNDGANTVAEHIGGTIPTFMDQLNAYLISIGCKETTLKNPHGLHHPDHQTSPYDLAIIAREAMQNPTFAEIVATKQYVRPETNMQKGTALRQLNKLITPGAYYYPKAIGIKTGTHSIAKKNIVAAAKDGDRTLIAVLMHCEQRSDLFGDAKALFEAAFSQPKLKKVFFKPGHQTFEMKHPDAVTTVKTFTKQEVGIEYYEAEEEPLKCLLFWDHVKMPVKKGQKIGELRLVTMQGQAVFAAGLYSQNDVEISWAAWLRERWQEHQIWIVSVIALMVCFIVMRGMQRTSRA